MKTQINPVDKIFIVDDDEVFAATIAAFLKTRGYTTREFYTVNDCMLALKEETPTLIISDYNFSLENDDSKTDGFRFYSWVRKVHGNIPFIVFSGQQDGALVLKMVREGIRHYIMKDNQMFEELEDSLNELLA